MFTFIALPNGFAGDVASTTSDMIGSFSPFVILVSGVLLAGVLIQIIIHALKP